MNISLISVHYPNSSKLFGLVRKIEINRLISKRKPCVLIFILIFNQSRTCHVKKSMNKMSTYSAVNLSKHPKTCTLDIKTDEQNMAIQQHLDVSTRSRGQVIHVLPGILKYLCPSYHGRRMSGLHTIQRKDHSTVEQRKI